MEDMEIDPPLDAVPGPVISPIQIPFQLFYAERFHPGRIERRAAPGRRRSRPHRSTIAASPTTAAGAASSPFPAAALAATRMYTFIRRPPLPFKFKPGPIFNSSWFILPTRITLASTAGFLLTLTNSLKDSLAFVDYLSTYFSSAAPSPTPPLSSHFIIPISNCNLNKPAIASMRRLIYKNSRTRFLMRILLTRWLVLRRFRNANTEDLVTGDVPTRPVTLYDWSLRRTFTFEASTLFKDITHRLLLHDELWINAQCPRNPYTNLPLSIGQQHHLIEQLRDLRKTHWAIEGLRAVAYNFQRFITEYSTPLKYSAIRRIFQERSDDYIFVMLDFIEKEHEHFDRVFNRELYVWALNHRADCGIMERWAQACRLNCELQVSITDYAELQLKQERLINPITQALCSTPLLLIAARNHWNKERLAAGRR